MNLDITFCIADCLNADCERNLNFVSLPTGVNISQSDFSGYCNEYEECLGVVGDIYEDKELDFND